MFCSFKYTNSPNHVLSVTFLHDHWDDGGKTWSLRVYCAEIASYRILQPGIFSENPEYRLISFDAPGTDGIQGGPIGSDIQHSALTIGPNPTSSGLVTIYDLDPAAQDVFVMDMNGRMVQSSNVEGGINTEINISGQPAGTYIIIVADGTAILQQARVVKL